MSLLVRLGAALFATFPLVLWADETLPKAAADPLAGGYLIKLTLSLLGVLLVLFILLAMLKRVGGLPRAGRQQAMKVQGSLAVGPRERVVWIEVDGHQLVLGVASGQIEPLLHLPPADAAEAPAEPSDVLMDTGLKPVRSGADFSQTLNDVTLRSER